MEGFCPYSCGKHSLLSHKAVLLFPLFSVPKIVSKHSPLAQRVGWVYFLLEVFTSTLELAGRRPLKSMSKQFFSLPMGANPLLSTSIPAAVVWVETDLCYVPNIQTVQGNFMFKNRRDRKSLGQRFGEGYRWRT